MAHYDEATSDFMSDMQADPHKALSTTKKLTKIIQNPKREIPRAIATEAVREIFSQKEASLKPIEIYKFMNEHHGRDWWDWEPETIWHTLEVEHGITSTDDVKNLVMALQVTLNTHAPFEHWHIFEKVGHALNFNLVDFQMLHPLELNEAAWTRIALLKIRPKDEFDSEVSGYIASIAKQDGLVYLPSMWFGGAQAFLDSMGNDTELRDEVGKRFDLGREPAESDPLPLKIQLLRLKAIGDYVREMM